MVVNKFEIAAEHRNIRQGSCGGCLRLIKRLAFWRMLWQFPILALLALVAFGCASPKTQIKEVLIPQKCEVSAKIRPIYKGEVVEDLRQTLVYIELLEQDLQICRGENNETRAK